MDDREELLAQLADLRRRLERLEQTAALGAPGSLHSLLELACDDREARLTLRAPGREFPAVVLSADQQGGEVVAFDRLGTPTAILNSAYLAYDDPFRDFPDTDPAEGAR